MKTPLAGRVWPREPFVGPEGVPRERSVTRGFLSPRQQSSLV